MATARRAAWAIGAPLPSGEARSFALDLASFQEGHAAAASAFRETLFACAEPSDSLEGACELKCDYCPRTFGTGRGLKRHRYNCRLHHLERTRDGLEERDEPGGGGALFPCDLCNKRCRSQGGLQRHREACSVKRAAGPAVGLPMAQAGEMAQCDLCARFFTSGRGLKRHRHACLQARGHVTQGIVVDAGVEGEGCEVVASSVVAYDPLDAQPAEGREGQPAVVDAVVVSVEAAAASAHVGMGEVLGQLVLVEGAQPHARSGADEHIDQWARRQLSDMCARGEMTQRDVAVAAGILPRIKAGDVYLSEYLHVSTADTARTHARVGRDAARRPLRGCARSRALRAARSLPPACRRVHRARTSARGTCRTCARRCSAGWRSATRPTSRALRSHRPRSRKACSTGRPRARRRAPTARPSPLPRWCPAASRRL